MPRIIIRQKPEVVCADAIAELYFDGELIDTLSIPSGDTDSFNIDCSTLLNAVRVESDEFSHQHTGTFVLIGEENGKPKYEKDGDPDRVIRYNGTRWILEKLGGGAHTHDAAIGDEDFPWLANWDDAFLLVSQATIGTYCANGAYAYYRLVDTDGNVLFTGSIPSGDTADIVAPDTDLEINGTPEGSFTAGSTIDLQLTDGVNPVTPDAVSVVGNTVTVEVAAGGGNGWTRPSDWLTLPTVTDTDDTFVGLYAIFPSGNNFAAMRFQTSTGMYQVDWGDGTITTHVSNTVAEHTYNYSTYDTGNATLSSRGYKQAVIVVTALTGDLTFLDLQRRVVTTPAQNQRYATGFLDIKVSIPNYSAQQCIIGGVAVRHSYLEQVAIYNLGACNAVSALFYDCFALQSIPDITIGGATNCAQMFFDCASLQSVPLFNTANVTNMSLMFSGCRSLQSVPLFDTSNATNMGSMFANCNSIKKVPLFDTTSVTNMASMFSGCNSLQSVPLFDTPINANFNTTFNNCQSLQEIPAFDTSSATDMVNFATNCNSLDRTNIVCRVSVNFNNCQLSRAELVNIFNNLLDRSATTAANINISGNWGASALTTTERDIALNKNWTITG
jgi:surface protein